MIDAHTYKAFSFFFKLMKMFSFSFFYFTCKLGARTQKGTCKAKQFHYGFPLFNVPHIVICLSFKC